MTAAIEIDGLTKRFRDVCALDAVTLDIESGELFGLLGPNGAGKSTLIHLLSTLQQPTAGSASVGGHEIQADPAGVRSQIGVVFQEPALDRALTARENLELHAALYGLDGPARRRRLRSVIDLVELADRADDVVGTYSGGMRRRLEIARGLLHRPAVLLLDEPTLGLDPQARRAVWGHITRLNRVGGLTVVLATHYLEEAETLCDRLAIIDAGRLLEVGTPPGLTDRLGGDVVSASFTGPPAIASPWLTDRPWVSAIEEVDGGLRVTVDDGPRRIPSLVRAFEAQGRRIRRMTLDEASLEHVFLERTGRGLDGPRALERRQRVATDGSAG